MSDEYLPILLIGFNRVDLLHKRIAELVENNVQTIFLSIDGSPQPNQGMEDFLSTIRNYIPNNIELNIMRSDRNLGLALHITSRIDELLKKHKAILILEDDIKIGRNFLSNMQEGLRHLQAGKSKGVVSAFSPVMKPKSLKFSNRWRSTPYFNCWGWICTKDAWSGYALDISNQNLNLELRFSRTWNQLSRWQQYLWLSRFIKIQRSPNHTWDIQFQYHCFKNEFVNFAPTFSLSDNEGFNDSRSAHTKDRKPRWWMKSNLDERPINKKASKLVELIFHKIFEPLTTAGDSRIVRYRHKIKNYYQKR